MAFHLVPSGSIWFHLVPSGAIWFHLPWPFNPAHLEILWPGIGLTCQSDTKKESWRHIIDNAKEDRDLYRIIAWHKLEPKNQEPPLIIGQQTLTNTTAKAEALRKAILTRFSAEDDLPTTLANILNSRVTPATLLWDTHLTPEETEKSVVGVTSTSPGTDRLTVRLLKACWQHVRLFIHQIYQNCLELQHFPLNWKVAEVAMIPKAGKTDYSTPRAWRPIALLSCLGKGLERIIARRFSWTALKTQLLNPQHCSALPRRSATDLAASFTHDAELALSQGKQVTMVTMDIQGAFDALLVHRLLTRLLQQGWPDTAITIVHSFGPLLHVGPCLVHAPANLCPPCFVIHRFGGGFGLVDLKIL